MPTPFLGVYTVLYDYEPNTDQELPLSAGDLLYILEISEEDEWWTAKKHAPAGQDEPQGLVPSNYIQPAPVIATATVLYDYTPQTEEELAIQETQQLNVYDTSDPDWVLVGSSDNEYGFAPANYLEISDTIPAPESNGTSISITPAAPVSAAAPDPTDTPSSALAAISSAVASSAHARQSRASYEEKDDYENAEDDDEPPYLPPRDASTAAVASRTHDDVSDDDDQDADLPPPKPSRPTDTDHEPSADFYSWDVQEIDSKGRKTKAKFGFGNNSVIFSPEAKNKAPQQWSISNIVYYNSEKKHVFIDLKHPTASLELHAGTKDAAEEIIQTIRTLVSEAKPKALDEVLNAANSGRYRVGEILYDFDAQSSDELSAREGDKVFIIDSSKSDEWWMVKNSLTGKQGVVPASYVTIIKTPKPEKKPSTTVPYADELERELDHSTSRASRRKSHQKKSSSERHSPSKPSKARDHHDSASESHSNNKNSKVDGYPDPNTLREWTDRTGTFRVDAAFLGYQDGLFHLHKKNGVKIAVPKEKLSTPDIEYVERITGQSVISTRNSPIKAQFTASRSNSGVSPVKVGPPPQTTRPPADGYDWFDFFLSCGVDVSNCQRYALSFERDRMDEAILPDIDNSVLRTLGLKEGDIIRVMKVLDKRFNRTKQDEKETKESLFSGPNGQLKNNTGKERTKSESSSPLSTANPTGGTNAPPSPKKSTAADAIALDTMKKLNLLDDTVAPTPSPKTVPQLTGSMRDLAGLQPPSGISAVPTGQSTSSLPPPLIPTKTASSPLTMQKTQPLASQYTSSVPSTAMSLPLQQPAPTQPLQSPFTGYSGIIPQNTQGAIVNGLQQPQPTGYVPQGTMNMQYTGMQPGRGMSVPAVTGGGLYNGSRMNSMPMISPPVVSPNMAMGMPVQQTGMMGAPLQQTGMMGAPPLSYGMQPTMTGMVPNMTGYANGMTQPVNYTLPPAMVPQTTGAPVLSAPARPLQQQKTGPMPNVSFGTKPPPLKPQNTGQRANLAAASAENPFGF
ncbi:hypothetical protein CANCADRAFT_44921 [Tortispora caseinolytica NRRL Y-17796]|uniref:Actin cytoskeleton-regulatory complex protein SLA1 n=1 Tax=Tortispora caseinolytica NRRL Y-17796 TaxID=767744 RepID=A0A1E4THT9_9ASCO|nr:hypothetical protein CANCADRAFT_44921 [Tortispora caseinolytica NRRL Y-17796]